MDMGAAQRATGQDGARGSHPDQDARRAGAFADWEQKIRAALPDGRDAESAGERDVPICRMLAAFRWNLRILSYIALLVGAFLIYNAVSVSVVRRRAESAPCAPWGEPGAPSWAHFSLRPRCLGLWAPWHRCPPAA